MIVRSRPRPLVLACLTLSALAIATSLVPAVGASDQGTPAPQTPCQGPEFRQFDFWAGSWDVYGARQLDRLAGRNTIQQASDGCALLESWSGARGMNGKSLNYYDPATGSWHQLWVGGDGVILHLEGGLEDGSMVLHGDDRQTPQGTIRDRITWTPNDDGTVRQHWEVSSDGGATWQTVFDGTYRRSAE